MSPRRKLQIIVAVSTVMSFIAAAGAMYFATARYERATNDAQVERTSQFVERYVNEVVWQDHVEDVGTLAGDMARESDLRSAVAASDHAVLMRLLPVAGRRQAVTSGQISVVGVTVYDARGVVLAEHMSMAGLRTPAALSDLLVARERNERFERLRHIWTQDGAPYLSVAVPVGGLRRISGYLAVHVDPLHPLRDLDSRFAVHVRFTTVDRVRTLAELNGYQVPADATKLNTDVVVHAPDGEPVFRVEMQADETASAQNMSATRAWSFAILFAVLSLISSTTLALVLLVSRRMAREEAEAAKAALEAKRTEERNADLQRLNETLRRSEEALQVQNQRFAAALDNMAHGMCMFDKERRLVVCNKRYLTMYGLSPEVGEPGTPLQKILEARLATGVTPVDETDYVAAVVRRVARPESRYRVSEMRDGRFIAVASRPMLGGGWVAVHQDVTAQKRAEAEVAHMARHDVLTGLANRVLFREKLDDALARLRRDGEGFCVFVLDLDRFKEANDAFGHLVGDALLIKVAERLRDAVGGTDAVARLGGDEFAVLTTVDRDDECGPVALAQRVLAVITEPYDVDGHHLVIAASIGIARAPDHGTDLHELLRNADLALYRAKSENCAGYCFFAAEMHDEARVLRTIGNDLRAAVEKRQFELHYQPIVSAATKAIIGVEALVRWRHPERGLVAPAEFIHIAEQTGLIVPLGEWVLHRACADAAGWPSHVKLAVNLSPAQFERGNLVEIVSAALARSGLAPERLELEITESLSLQKDAANVAVLHELGRLGVAIVLDDFGTGYSSLSYLQMFPFHKIKIDKSFVDDLSRREERASMVAAIAGLARSLDIGTTAEGVETLTQFEMLRAAGCNEVQGYLFGRPCPVSQLSFAAGAADEPQVA